MYNLEDISDEEIVSGRVPLPTQENIKAIEVIKKVKKDLDFDFDVARIENRQVRILRRKDKYLNDIIMDSDENIVQEDIFKRKDEPDTLAVSMTLLSAGIFAGALPWGIAFYYNKPIIGVLGFPFLSLESLGAYLIGSYINNHRPSTKERKEKTIQYEKNVIQLLHTNRNDLNEAIKDIKVYEGSIEEVSQDLGRELRRIDTKKPETFIKAKDSLYLRLQTYLLGGDAIVHYQPGSSIGTPVKFGS